MMVQSTALSSQQASVRVDRPTSSGAESPSRAPEVRQEPQESRQSGPDVVASISAAGLEASRAVTEASRAAEQGRTEDVVRQAERAEPQKRVQSQEQSIQGGRPPRGVNLLV